MCVYSERGLLSALAAFAAPSCTHTHSHTGAAPLEGNASFTTALMQGMDSDADALLGLLLEHLGLGPACAARARGKARSSPVGRPVGAVRPFV